MLFLKAQVLCLCLIIVKLVVKHLVSFNKEVVRYLMCLLPKTYSLIAS